MESNKTLSSIILASAFVAIAALPARADIIKLKNGETLEGIVVSKDKNYVTIQVASGELGFDAAFVDSIDTEKGPRSTDDLTKTREANRARLDAENQERASALARVKAAAVAEASATRESNATNDTASTTATSDSATRLNDLNETLSKVPRKREREKLRRALLNLYFGVGSYDPVLRIGRM